MKSEHWEKRAPSLSQCKKKFADILFAENLLKEDAGSWAEFSKNLGNSELGDEFLDFSEEKVEEKNTSSMKSKQSKRKRGVGIRSPHRDSLKKN